MSKYIPSVLVGLVFFAAGYLFHLKLNNPLVAESLVGGDINKAATQSITNPEEQADLLTCRMNEYVFLSTWVLDYARMINDTTFTTAIEQLSSVQKQSVQALKDCQKAYGTLSSQIEACEAFVDVSDKRIASFPEMDVKLASLRDLMVSFALHNAYLLGDQAGVDRLKAIPEQVALTEDMAYNFSFSE